MPIRLYNTLTQKVEDFTPREPGKASMYVCGLTTYDRAHAGHGRTYTTFDVLFRLLRARGLDVVHCRNVTDVDDRIIDRARQNGEEPLALSRRMSDLADKELREIGCARPHVEPRVSTSIDDIIALVEKLIEKGNAYVVETPSGYDVYYAVKSFSEYGKLSHRNIGELRTGASERLASSDQEVKRDPLDFALWKGAKNDGFGWESPWGKGRPGWHIECSAMAMRHLGDHIDIHCGGMDLIFPHHENEIAQSEALAGPELARVWMHGGFLEIDKEKMSKSLGNFVTIGDVLERNDAEAFRYFALGTHYRGPLSFDVEKNEETSRVSFPGLDEAERRAEYLYSTHDALVAVAADAPPIGSNVLQGQAKIVDEAPEKVLEALDKDLNTPVALSILAELAKAGNEIVMQAPKMRKDPAKHEAVRGLAAKAAKNLLQACAPLGLMQATSEEFWARTKARRLRIKKLDEHKINAKVKARTEARSSKDFAKADALRKELVELGVDVFDSGDASTWKLTL